MTTRPPDAPIWGETIAHLIVVDPALSTEPGHEVHLAKATAALAALGLELRPHVQRHGRRNKAPKPRGRPRPDPQEAPT